MVNQTDPSWLEGISVKQKGTGVFAIPNLDIPGAIRKVFIKDITYTECIDRGRLATAFKWVPSTVATYSALIDEDCGGLQCVERCAKPGCICHDGVCT